MKFETEKELVQFFVDAGIVIDRLTIQVIKDKGYVENSIVDEAEAKFQEYYKKEYNFSLRDDLLLKAKESWKVISVMRDAIQYLKSEVQELKDGKNV